MNHFLVDGDISVVYYVFCSFIICTVATSLFWPWWKSDMGWTVVLEASCIVVLLFPSILGLALHVNVDTTFWQWWALVSFFLVGTIAWWRLLVIWVIQRYDPPVTKSGRKINRDKHSPKGS